MEKDNSFVLLNTMMEMVKNFTDEDVELFIILAKEKANVNDEEDLRKVINKIRFE